jgi:hypothetical protein
MMATAEWNTKRSPAGNRPTESYDGLVIWKRLGARWIADLLDLARKSLNVVHFGGVGMSMWVAVQRVIAYFALRVSGNIQPSQTQP